MTQDVLERIVVMSGREIHLRKNPDDATMKPVECGEVGVASITEAWGYYGPGGEGHKDVCCACIDARRARSKR
jgi:hypothetical protein